MGVAAALTVSLGIPAAAVAGPAGTVVPNAAKPADPSTLTAPDALSAQVDARAKGVKIEVLSELTPDSTTYANPNGSFTTESFGSPIRVADKSSKTGWDDIDYTLVKRSDGTVGPKVDPVSVSLSGKATAAQVAKSGVVSLVGASASAVAFGWKGALPDPTLDGDTATYTNVAPNMDLVIKMTATGFEQYFVLNAKPTAAEMSLVLPLTSKGLTPSLGADGSVAFTNTRKQRAASIPAAYMWDSRIDPASGLPADTAKLGMTVGVPATPAPVIGATGNVITLTPPTSFFSDPKVKYPVTIDPSVTEGSNGDTFVRSDSPTTTYQSYTPGELQVGTYNSGTSVARSFLNFSDAGWEGQDVTAATLKLYEFHSYNCTASTLNVYYANAESASTDWNNQPAINTSYSGSVTTAKGYSSACAAAYISINVKNVAAVASTRGLSTIGMSLRASETADGGWKRFNSADATSNKPSLVVTYDRYPSTATAPTLSPAATYNGTQYTSSLTPTFASSGADADGGTTKVTFEVDSNTTGTVVTSCTTALVAQATTASCTPATALTDGTTYYVRAQSNDGTVAAKAWSAYTTFKVQHALPPTPTIKCAGYTFGSWVSTMPTSPVSCAVSVAAPITGQAQDYQIQTQVDSRSVVSTPVTLGAAGSATVSVPNTPGPHQISASAVSLSGQSAESFDKFGYGGAGMSSPVSGTKTNDIVRLSASAPPAGTSAVTATVQWRPANSAGTAWNTAVNSSGATISVPVTSTSSATTVSNFAWSTASATTDTTTGSSVTLNPRLSALLELRLCFAYSPGGTKCTATSASPLTVLRVPHAFDSGFPVESAGDGQVALWTGELQLNTTDVSAPTPAGSLSIDRSHASFDGPQDPVSDVFGPGWSASFAGDGSGAAADQVQDSTGIDGTITLLDSELTSETFREPGGGKTAEIDGTYSLVTDGATDSSESTDKLVVAGSGATLQLRYTTIDGTVTVWKPVSGAAAHIQWVPQSVAQAGAQGTETYKADSSGRVTQILAPLPAGVTCTPSGPSGLLQAGCSALQIAYAPATTATSSTPGDYSGQVSSISYEAYDPSVSAMTISMMATYKYDTGGHLLSVTHPLTDATHPAVSYKYNTSYAGDTLVASTSTPGYATTTYNYSNATGDARLQNVTEGGATSGAASSIQSAYVYGVDPTATGLADLSTSTVNKWGQTVAPAGATAVFGADHPVDTDNAATLLSEPGWTAAQWQNATLDYTDANGYEVNTADYGAGEWLRTFTNYDTSGNELGSLTATNVDDAVAQNLGSSADVDQMVMRYNAAQGTVGAANYIAAGTYVTDEWSAPFTAQVAGAPQLVRTHTHYDYDQGAPASDVNPATSQLYLLQTAVTVGVSTTDSASADPTVSLPADVQTTSTTDYGYDPIDGSSTTGATSGWTLGQPTVTNTVMPGTGNNIVHKTLFDANGSPIEAVAPLSNGADAGTTKTITYTAGANAADAACGSKPQWAGMPCWSGPAAQASDASTVAPIASTRITGFNLWLSPTEEVQTSGSATRTADVTYLSDDRKNTTTVSTSGLTGSTAVPVSKVIYDPTTHAQTGTASLDGSGSVTGSDTSTIDLWGRTTGYTNSLGDTTTTSYVSPGSVGAGAVHQVVTPSGPTATETSTYSYDGTDASGNTEHRGLATGLSITGVGSFAAAYDQDGDMVDQTMPGGTSESWQYNDQGQLDSLTYSGDVTADDGTVSTGSWLSYSRDYDAAGRVADEWTPDGGTDLVDTGYSNQYTYDQAGRLTGVVAAQTDGDGNTGCAARQYTFDAQGDRTDLNSATDPSVCPTLGSGTDTTSAYDNFSRQLTGADGAGSYVYDAFGRQTTIPPADAPGGANAAISLSYFDTDSVQSITQTVAGVTAASTFGLDPDGRRAAESITGSSPSTITDHYVDGSDSPGYASQVGSSGTTFSSYLQGLSGLGATVTTQGRTSTASLGFSDLSGSIVATVDLATGSDATGLTTSGSTDEYGNAAGSTVSTGVLSYGWEGSAQREVSNAGLTLMGARLYNPATGRFTGVDPMTGGNENSYDYPNDPVNLRDLTGTRSCDLTCTILIGTISIAIGIVCTGFFPEFEMACAAVAGAVDGAVTYFYRWAGTKHFSWLGLATAAVSTALLYAIPIGIIGTVGRVVVKVLTKIGRREAAAMVSKYWADLVTRLRGKKH
jgi:RHS repeat-associated protein